MTASGPFKYYYGCVRNVKTHFYKEQHHSTRIHGLFVLFPYSVHQPCCLQKSSHTTDTYISHMKAFPYIFEIGRTDLTHMAG